MEIRPLKLAGTYAITLKPIADERGYFMMTYHRETFKRHGLVTHWVQENQSLSERGVLRGLHFQMPPYAETKLVRAIHGAILDVFVDIRTGSPTYGQWDSLELSDQNHTMAYIPRGFAHGFCVLSSAALVAYKVDAYYAPQAVAGLQWDDPAIGIRWPVDAPILSEKDRALPPFARFDSPFSME
mgnify:CR=1 FL=1